MSKVVQVTALSMDDLVSMITSLQERVTALESSTKSNPSTAREMTDDDARMILNGIHAASKHKVAAEALGLTYGQVYSCRGEYTFKHIHKELKEAGFKNTWAK